MNVKEKIKDIHFHRAVFNISRPITDSIHTVSQIGFYIVELVTVEDIRGQRYMLSFHYSPGVMEGAFRDVYSLISAGEYAVYGTVLARADQDREAEHFGNTGVNNCAITAVDPAMQDAWGYICRQPVWKTLGADRRRAPVYGNGGWVSYTDQGLLEEVLDYKKRGFKTAKIRVGSGSIERDTECLIKYREALGDSVKIMMDANQRFNVPDALELTRRAFSMGIQWFEEPAVYTDYTGYQLLRNQCDIALIMEEWEYDFGALEQLLVHSALGLWQPGIVRLGGVKAWKESAVPAETFGSPVLPHYYRDYDALLLCMVRSPYGTESSDWIDGIIDNTMEIENGLVSPRGEDGWGFCFREECMTEVQELSWDLSPDRNWYHIGFPCMASFSSMGPLK